jgi:hypothetical protein
MRPRLGSKKLVPMHRSGIPDGMVRVMKLGRTRRRTHEVFGVSPDVLQDSYVDRGSLDEELKRLLRRKTHIALRGESKCGKSWLRRKVMPDALVVQCRLGRTMIDIYRDALSQLGIRLVVESKEGDKLTGRIEAQAEAGISLLAKLGIRSSIEATSEHGATFRPVGRDLDDLRFIAEVLIASRRRLVIEDFHYLSEPERRSCAFDIKTLWDHECFVVVVGIWNDRNLFLNLNPELAGRVQEVPIEWNPEDLQSIFGQGGAALNIVFSDDIKTKAVRDCFKNAGILQRLILGTLDEAKVYKEQDVTLTVDDKDAYEAACLTYVDELNAIYQTFANRVSSGIRTRNDTTGIYAHAMAVVLDESDDDELSRGVGIDKIYAKAHARQPRIQKGNLHTILSRIEVLQVDDAGRGLVLVYNERDQEVTVVDRQLLLYRRYATVKWPWEDLIREAEEADQHSEGPSETDPC